MGREQQESAAFRRNDVCLRGREGGKGEGGGVQSGDFSKMGANRDCRLDIQCF